MANANTPHGLSFARTKHGGPPSINKYNAFSSETICKGDIVEAACSDGAANVMLSATTILNRLLGVAASYSASGTTDAVWVYDDVWNTVFYAQLASSLASTDRNMIFNTCYVAGSTITGISNLEIKATTLGTRSDLGLNLIGLVGMPNNEWGLNAEVYCNFYLTTR